ARMLLWASENRRIESMIRDARLTRGVVKRFVAGDSLEDAVEAIKDLNARGIGGILDLLGEGVTDPHGAAVAAGEYRASIKRIEETGIDTTVSVKLTQLGLAFDKGACIDHLRRLAAEAQAIEPYLEIDMEQSAYVFDTIDVYRLLQADFPEMRLAVQAYLRRTPVDLETMAALKPKVRLVKGAYAEPDELAFQKGDEIDSQYRFLTDWLFERGTDPGIATHDHTLISYAQRRARDHGVDKDGFEIQMLYGIRRDLQDHLARDGYRVRVYVPFGSSWYPYLMRRMAERPANLKFFLRAVAGR
ncbi:MAG: proline dehydrogenase family protein, partial [Actinomycetota bacterium]|nr:proline dehydrogenase family protein [Actinomycetota bacterium]